MLRSSLLLNAFYLGTFSKVILPRISEKSPYHQYLPDCSNGTYPMVLKETKVKGIVCPMVKDEEGFLSEWTAYYEMQGFNHIIFYDNNSTLSFAEINPWIQSGFVSIRRNWWINDKMATAMITGTSKKTFNGMMRIKLLAEADCKKFAVENGYQIFLSVDMDEYIFPTNPATTVMDELVNWFQITTRGVAPMVKINFPPIPHFLEPIHLLTIEAYQTRNTIENKMDYYTTVMPKVALLLYGGINYTPDTIQMMILCCDFHGCHNFGFDTRCHDLIRSESSKILGKEKKWMTPPHIHHYTRSLEKYALKSKSWDTSGRKRGYNFHNFLERTFGFELDNSSLSCTCQLRALLRNRTGEEHYVRPGNFWYRNPEYGRLVEDPEKRGRGGAGYKKRVSPEEMNPYPPGDTYQKAHKAYSNKN
eukprot:gene112-165_t